MPVPSTTSQLKHGAQVWTQNSLGCYGHESPRELAWSNSEIETCPSPQDLIQGPAGVRTTPSLLLAYMILCMTSTPHHLWGQSLVYSRITGFPLHVNEAFPVPQPQPITYIHSGNPTHSSRSIYPLFTLNKVELSHWSWFRKLICPLYLTAFLILTLPPHPNPWLRSPHPLLDPQGREDPQVVWSTDSSAYAPDHCPLTGHLKS